MSYRWSFNSSLWHPTPSDLAKISGIIQPEELKRIARFHFIRDAKSSLIGRLLIRKLINHKTNTPNELIQLARDDHNKPILVSPKFTQNSSNSPNSPNSDANQNPTTTTTNLNFNVSHQGSFVVLASDPSSTLVGIDVMNIQKPGRISENVDEYFSLMNRQFTQKEWSQIRGGDIEDKKKLTNFTRFWCLKEAYVKAVGVGIVIDLKTIDFLTKSDLQFDPDFKKVITNTEVKVGGGLEKEWKFEERFLDSQHIVTVAKKIPKVSWDDSDTDLDLGDVNIPDFQEVTLDFLLEGMNPLGPEDEEWILGFLAKK